MFGSVAVMLVLAVCVPAVPVTVIVAVCVDGPPEQPAITVIAAAQTSAAKASRPAPCASTRLRRTKISPSSPSSPANANPYMRVGTIDWPPLPLEPPFVAGSIAAAGRRALPGANPSVIVKVDVTEPPFGVTVGEPNVQLKPLGSPEHANDTAWLKPPAGVTVMIDDPGVDFVTVTLVGFADSVKEPAVDVMVTCTAGEVDEA